MKRETFVLNTDLYDKTISLSNEELGKLIRKILLYVSNKELPTLEDKLELVFDFIKFDLDKNYKKYEERCKQNSENGKRGGAPKGNNNAQKQPKTTETTETTENNMTHHNHIHTHTHDHNHNQIIKEVINYLNIKTNSNYKYSTKSTQEKIKARLNEGFNLNDFIVVIDKKTEEWIDDSKMSVYLRPETLFGTKFESYLNQQVVHKKTLKDISMADIDRMLEEEKRGGNND